ncbi:hypothetical protein [Desulfotalea psychrophila]|uniref:hypothetical protein n=1 Tax=Desulfotalea psychrophila TaxID=84980 RepID=UPI00059DED8F|nr:hypothetical protein [Desulfotalea psychrophila]
MKLIALFSVLLLCVVGCKPEEEVSDRVGAYSKVVDTQLALFNEIFEEAGKLRVANGKLLLTPELIAKGQRLDNNIIDVSKSYGKYISGNERAMQKMLSTKHDPLSKAVH